MSIRATALSRFRRRVDAALLEFFPCRLRFSGGVVAASGPGARAMEDFMEGGKSPNFRFPFRIPTDSMLTAPRIGDPAEWLLGDGRELALEVLEVAFRPHEEQWAIVCRNRRK